MSHISGIFDETRHISKNLPLFTQSYFEFVELDGDVNDPFRISVSTRHCRVIHVPELHIDIFQLKNIIYEKTGCVENVVFSPWINVSFRGVFNRCLESQVTACDYRGATKALAIVTVTALAMKT